MFCAEEPNAAISLSTAIVKYQEDYSVEFKDEQLEMQINPTYMKNL